MKVQGRDCTLTVAKDNEYYPLPYSEETVRQTSKGYVLPGVIAKYYLEEYEDDFENLDINEKFLRENKFI